MRCRVATNCKHSGVRISAWEALTAPRTATPGTVDLNEVVCDWTDMMIKKKEKGEVLRNRKMCEKNCCFYRWDRTRWKCGETRKPNENALHMRQEAVTAIHRASFFALLWFATHISSHAFLYHIHMRPGNRPFFMGWIISISWIWKHGSMSQSS